MIGEQVMEFDRLLFEIDRVTEDFPITFKMLGCLIVNKNLGRPGFRINQFLGMRAGCLAQ